MKLILELSDIYGSRLRLVRMGGMYHVQRLDSVWETIDQFETLEAAHGCFVESSGQYRVEAAQDEVTENLNSKMRLRRLMNS